MSLNLAASQYGYDYEGLVTTLTCDVYLDELAYYYYGEDALLVICYNDFSKHSVVRILHIAIYPNFELTIICR